MIDSSDIIKYKKDGFDGSKYIKLQSQSIEDRLAQFSGGRLYLEIGGKFLYDAHAARVLPGFNPESKKLIFDDLIDQAEVLFCVNAQDIEENRQLSNKDINYIPYVHGMISDIEKSLGIKPHVVMNMMDPYSTSDEIMDFQRDLQRKGYRVWERYSIENYPDDTDTILSEDGFGQDDHIPLTQNLILVTGAASNSGKMSTCLGQIYQDNLIDIKSGYAKYETFPIWNLPLDHPINLAYEAATADIGDFNCWDELYIDAYGTEAVNYNRDVEAFEIVQSMSNDIVGLKNYMRSYKSPTDMGVSNAGFCIKDDEICCIASYQEIERRKEWYDQMLKRGEGDKKWVERCDKLLLKCKEYMDNKGYKIDKKI